MCVERKQQVLSPCGLQADVHCVCFLSGGATCAPN
jgi:hypothetical protein